MIKAVSILTKLFSFILRLVFRTSKGATDTMGAQFLEAVKALTKLSARQLKEFLIALPVFIRFVGELLRNRKSLHAQNQLQIVGAAAALSSIGIFSLVAVLGSLPFQILLAISYPILGIPLLLSAGVIIFAIILILVWLVIYGINAVMADDPVYQRIRAEYIRESYSETLKRLSQELETNVAGIDELKAAVAESLKRRGQGIDAEQLERSLKRLERNVESRAFKRFTENAEKLELEATEPSKEPRG